MNRRKFLTKCAMSLAAFQIIPRHILGGKGYVAANDKINVGLIGCGNIAGLHRSIIDNDKRLQCVSVCDVREERRNRYAREYFPKSTPYNDFRNILDRTDVDVVHIATPPHWHAVMAIMAAQSGKDVFLEKPMTRTVGETRKVVDAIKAYNRIFRINTWFRIGDTDYYNFGPSRKIKKLCQSGLLGWPLRFYLTQGSGIDWKIRLWQGQAGLTPEPIPNGFDYDLWLGPAPQRFFNSKRVDERFRGYWDYDGGGLADMGQHFLDPVQYFLGKDNESPVRVEADTVAPSHPFIVTPNWKSVKLTYADGCEIILESELAEKKPGQPLVEGPKGKLYLGFRTDPPDLVREVDRLPDPEPQNADFVDCIRNRQPFALNEDSSARSNLLVHMANAAIRTGHALDFDPDNWRFTNDVTADCFVNQIARAPWNQYI